MQKDFFSLSTEELKELVSSINEPTFRSAQIWNWIYCKGAKDFASMSNLSNSLRIALPNLFSLTLPDASNTLISSDGTIKWLLKFIDSNQVETVFIPEKNRGTLCISSQVGCTLTCKFCHTGTQKLVRNLTSGEIITQLLYAKNHLNDWPSDKEHRALSNIVLMGMGEPLLNYDNVLRAVQIMTDPKGLNLSRHKITLSTSGIVPNIKNCAIDLGVNLAVSLHATTDELRNILVPINKKYPIAELLEACRYYSQQTKRKQITFEYVMLKGVNDSITDAKHLVKLIAGIPAKINLIPFNRWPGASYQCSEANVIQKFAKIIEDAGYISPVRSPRGQDIMAACGQLKSDSVRS